MKIGNATVPVAVHEPPLKFEPYVSKADTHFPKSRATLLSLQKDT